MIMMMGLIAHWVAYDMKSGFRFAFEENERLYGYAIVASGGTVPLKNRDAE